MSRVHVLLVVSILGIASSGGFVEFPVVGLVASPHEDGGSPQNPSCESAKELLTDALKGATTGDRLKLAAALEQIKLAIRRCPSLGDAYYFAALIYSQLGDATNAAFNRQRAEMFASQALREGRDLSGQGAVAAIAGPPMRIGSIVKRRLALVIGIGRFKDVNINPLRFTANDAKAIADSLTNVAKFDYVKSLIDGEATGYNIKTEVDRLAKMAEPEDLVAIYFSSHGSPDSADTAGINYIVTHDTEVNNLYATAYKMEDLLSDITFRIKAERVVAFLDTCYSGGTFKSAPPGWAVTSRTLVSDAGPQAGQLESRLKSGSKVITVDPEQAATNRVPQGIGRVVITSSAQNEKSWEDERLQHGYFTYFLLAGIREKTPVSIEDLYDYVKRRVSDAVSREKNQSQHPSIARNQSRVNVFIRDEIASVPTKK